MGPDLDTLATTLYVTADDLLIQHPHWAPERPAVGIAPPTVRRRVGHPGGDRGAAQVRFRSPFRALRPRPSGTLVPLSAHPGRPTTSGCAAASGCSSM